MATSFDPFQFRKLAADYADAVQKKDQSGGQLRLHAAKAAIERATKADNERFQRAHASRS